MRVGHICRRRCITYLSRLCDYLACFVICFIVVSAQIFPVRAQGMGGHWAVDSFINLREMTTTFPTTWRTCLPRPVMCGHCPHQTQNGAENRSKSECLPYLNLTHIDNCICSASISGEKRVELLRQYSLRHCYHYRLASLLNKTSIDAVKNSSAECSLHLRDLLKWDELVKSLVCPYIDIVNKYDCKTSYSVQYGCYGCKVSLPYKIFFAGFNDKR